MAWWRPRSELALERRGERPGEPERAFALRGAALAMFACSVALTVAAIRLFDDVAGRPGVVADFSLDPALITAGLAFALTGLLLCWARPHNPVGWLLALSRRCCRPPAWPARSTASAPW